MSAHHHHRAVELIVHLAARFFERESSGRGLITVTRANLSDDGKNSTVFFTVFPDSEEARALSFAKRSRSDFKKFVKENSQLVRIPFFDFDLDLGEKNRQQLDKLSGAGERT